jgi:beta-galactosidase
VSATVRNYSDQAVPARMLPVALFDAKGKPVAGAGAEISVPKLNPGEEKSVAAAVPVSKPAKWTAETPNLYTTALTLAGSKEGEVISTRTGFRKIEIKERFVHHQRRAGEAKRRQPS